MTTQTYTHRDLSRLLGVSETTVKSYRSKFPGFLPVAREGKPVRLHLEALEVCRRIRDHFAEGLTIHQTAERLRGEFKEYPLAQRQAAAGRQATGMGLGADLDGRLEALVQAQEQVRRRMEQMEAEVRNLAAMEAASKGLVLELLQEFRAARAEPAKPALAAPPTAAQPGAAAGGTVLTARKIVTVHGQAGQEASYVLGREPKPEQAFAPPALPGEDFLDLPAVIRSDKGEFLALPGGQSIARLVELLRLQGGGQPSWFAEGPETWVCEVPLGPALTRELFFERTTTPRGNRVGLFRRMRVLSGSDVSEFDTAALQGFFRDLRLQLS